MGAVCRQARSRDRLNLPSLPPGPFARGPRTRRDRGRFISMRTRIFHRRRSPEMMGRGPDFIIIGAMKCATSTLHEQLAIQPGLFMSRPKEPNFFSDDDIYAKGWDWYRGLFEGADERALCGESSTHYTKLPTYPHTVARIRRHLPRVKLIYIMRDPIERLISHYLHESIRGQINVSVDQAIEQHPELTAFGLYSRQLEP